MTVCSTICVLSFKLVSERVLCRTLMQEVIISCAHLQSKIHPLVSEHVLCRTLMWERFISCTRLHLTHPLISVQDLCAALCSPIQFQTALNPKVGSAHSVGLDDSIRKVDVDGLKFLRFVALSLHISDLGSVVQGLRHLLNGLTLPYVRLSNHG